MNSSKKITVKRICFNALFCALAYIVMLVVHIKISFLTYDPKDVVIAIAGLIFGPVTSVLISVIVALLEMFSASDTEFLGFVMNVTASLAFCLPLTIIYKYARTFRGAVIGLCTSVFSMTAIMILFNYFITPVYMKVPVEQVIPLLPTLILPFNLIKGCLNAGLVLLLYRQLVSALRAAKLLPEKETDKNSSKLNATVTVISVLLISASIVSFILIF